MQRVASAISRVDCGLAKVLLKATLRTQSRLEMGQKCYTNCVIEFYECIEIVWSMINKRYGRVVIEHVCYSYITVIWL